MTGALVLAKLPLPNDSTEQVLNITPPVSPSNITDSTQLPSDKSSILGMPSLLHTNQPRKKWRAKFFIDTTKLDDRLRERHETSTPPYSPTFPSFDSHLNGQTALDQWMSFFHDTPDRWHEVENDVNVFVNGGDSDPFETIEDLFESGTFKLTPPTPEDSSENEEENLDEYTFRVTSPTPVQSDDEADERGIDEKLRTAGATVVLVEDKLPDNWTRRDPEIRKIRHVLF
ncbi:hypothetical protein H0H93_005893, partial [Arthromyces matolae]